MYTQLTGSATGLVAYYKMEEGTGSSLSDASGNSNTGTMTAGVSWVGAPTISSFTPSTAGNGTTVTITGTNFTGVTAVSFGGTAATSFTFVSSTSITALVGSGTTGTVSVTTPGGTATSDGTLTFSLTKTWTGTADTDWNNPANWSTSAVPVSTDNMIISNVTNKPVVSDVTVASGSVLTIAPGAAFTVSGTLTNNSTGGVVIQSDTKGTGSLIVNASAGSGTTIAQRWMPYLNASPTWHLTSSPVTGQSVSGFLSANSNIPTSGSNRAMLDYKESTNLWNPYYTTGTGDITPGKGFCMLTGTAAAITFTGTLNAATYDVATARTGSYGWNCIGNPYTSAIKINEKTDANNFITINSSKFDLSGSYTAIYVWDETKSIADYQIINQSSEATYAPTGQAFFVKTATDGNTFAFTPAMQVHQSTLALKSGTAPWPEIKLAALVNGKSVSTTIKFIDGTTKGLDVGYDAGIFKSDPSLALYTRLVESNGVDFALQCLPNSNFSGLIIPVGLDCKTGGEVVFSAETINL